MKLINVTILRILLNITRKMVTRVTSQNEKCKMLVGCLRDGCLMVGCLHIDCLEGCLLWRCFYVLGYANYAVCRKMITAN